jgi:uracil-DNA glycosylase
MVYAVPIHCPDDMAEFRCASRRLLAAEIAPSDVVWNSEAAATLFGEPLPDREKIIAVPRMFVEMARAVACHRDEQRWSLLYQALWRIAHGENGLMEQVSDPLIHRLHGYAACVRRDQHRMTAFVRFREIPSADSDIFVAWYKPRHLILRQVATFFISRFANMRFSILTPDLSLHWDLKEERYAPGLRREDAASKDVVEDWWCRYYAAIFNPARHNSRLLKNHMPKFFWQNLPEARTIQRLLDEAGARTDRMIQSSPAAFRP